MGLCSSVLLDFYRGQHAIQLYIIVEKLIFGDCNDLVVRAFILVHSLLLMSLFLFDICIM